MGKTESILSLKVINSKIPSGVRLYSGLESPVGLYCFTSTFSVHDLFCGFAGELRESKH